MKMEKTSPQMIEFFNSIIPDARDIQHRLMFGYPSIFINGNLTAGLFGDDMLLRLGHDDRIEFLELPGAHLFEPKPGRPMKQYVIVPATVFDDELQLLGWLQKSLAYGRSLPLKTKK
jgi:TfoX/Sxy family transcriptional regulator of competence genes